MREDNAAISARFSINVSSEKMGTQYCFPRGFRLNPHTQLICHYCDDIRFNTIRDSLLIWRTDHFPTRLVTGFGEFSCNLILNVYGI